MAYNGFDDNTDPYQFGIHGWEIDSDGLDRMKGSALGVVLSVQAADSSDNFLYRMLQGDSPSDAKGSQIEASVLLLYDGKEIFKEISHVLVLQGKCSQYGPGEKEPSDWTEDVPNGCKDDELKAFYGDGGRSSIQNLSGDWVIVDFLGGILQLPMITRWFPNPNNNRDAATEGLGKRFLLRRNNSELSISDDGDFHITHRDGQYIQLKNRKITIKHREGQIIHLDEDGKVFISDKTGNSITLDDRGVALTSGTAKVDVFDKDVTVLANGGDVFLMASDSVQIVSPTVSAHSGAGGKPLCIDQMAQDFAVIAALMTPLISALKTLPPAAAIIEPYLNTPADVSDPSGKTKGQVLTETVVRSQLYSKFYLTQVLSGE